jgi:ribosomal protein S18 acetylase RimI-like enzyme
MTTSVSELAAAWFDALKRLCAVTPQGWFATHGDALALVSGAAADSLNLAVSTVPSPPAASRRALDEAAAQVSAAGLPWAVMVRGPADDAVTALAARYGLTEPGELPFMTCAAGDAGLAADEAADALITAVSAADSEAYTRGLAAGFGVPAAAFGSLMGGGVLDAPEFTGYLAAVGGQPLATGFGARTDGAVGVFNISVAPSARRRGLGRAMTARVLRDGFAAGAATAYLQPTAAAQALYQSMGFRVAERWTTFSAA